MRVTAASTIWICAGPKGRTTADSAKKCLAEYIEKYGKRGNIRLYENIDNGEFLTFTMGCKSYKGTVKEVAEKIVTGSVVKADAGIPGFKPGQKVLVDLGHGKTAQGVITKSKGTEPNPAGWVSVVVPKVGETRVPVSYVTTAGVVTAADELPARVAGQIIGDLKRIRSTVAAWRGKMPADEYKLFVTYESDVGDYIAKKYIPKMSKEYQEKAKGLKG